ncbi:bifunctional glutamate N-acetyltransferase/amino-acid acetyltransferase ArgJ [Poseidonocella sp. HB161398]|uniref:bifunctional glutamate N-acetyltransferase/amino-acid acetyltransferase ArgJ n=1 Tax=Poseidonocella sp. HB161398 TaxID=2320855 RepID=UPI0011083556|nr:bifunctional glutamate N-acetyltransferase/amino-acid acetyltransferase ArgJ [Poseidonocella sp. HB161398]
MRKAQFRRDQRALTRARIQRRLAGKPAQAAPAAPLVSPLAPAGGFPELPAIAGLELSSVAAGVKYKGRPDVMMARLAPGSVIAGVTTRSSTRSAPVLDCEAKLAAVEAPEAGAAFLVNAGNSNAFTGGRGLESVEAVTAAVAQVLDLPQSRIFTSSTGVIGQPLPHDRIIAALGTLAGDLSPEGWTGAARAIMTTDTFPKGSVETAQLAGGKVTVAGFAKGSGMIAPDMGTMLVYIFTDAKISQPALTAMLRRLTDRSFNSITVDSDTSTSDTLLVGATGQGAEVTDADEAAFEAALGAVMTDLALQVVRDGEGATKLLEVRVTGAESDADARKVALAIANSPLVKTAVAGEDPNWGRIVMAVGKSGARADRDLLSIRFGDILVAENGWVAPSYTEEAGASYMTQAELVVTTDLGLGAGSSTVWTCDLTHRYISINADYRS